MAIKEVPAAASNAPVAAHSAPVAAAILAAGIVISSLIGVWGFGQIRQADQTIVVTGSAKRRIVSDKVIWRAGVSFQSRDLQDAYTALTNNVPKVTAYLTAQGVKPSEIKLLAIEATTLSQRGTDGEDSGRLVGYSLKQTILVTSTDVPRIERISREATQLINQGFLLESTAPQYLYTGIADVKQDLLADAAKDARKRADKIASSVGSHVGGVRGVRMGVFQIAPADSTAVSSDGLNDTTSLEKDVTSVVNVTFSVR